MTHLTKASIFRHWLPLASTWLMMAIEGPYLAAIVARMDNPKLNLAAFGVAFAVGLLMESPVIMMMAAAARLIKDQQSYFQLRRFNIILSISCTILMLGLLVPSVFNFWVYKLLMLDQQIGKYVYMSLVCLLPWPGMIGYRRFYQGVLIKAKNNKRVAAGTVIRLMAMSICAYLSFNQKLLDGASVATLSLSAGVCAEALFIRMASRTRVRELISKRDIQTESKLTLPGVWTFYYPLALTAIIGLTVQPLITFGMGKALFPLESLAVLPVVNSLVFFFRAIPLSFQEVVITLVGEHESNRKSLQDFAIGLGAALTIILGTLTFTPLADLWFRQIAGLPEDLAKFAWAPLAIAIAVPALSLLLCWQRSILIHDKNTKPVTYASAIELIMVTLALGIGILGGAPYSGVTLAMVSLVIGRISSTTFLKARHKV